MAGRADGPRRAERAPMAGREPTPANRPLVPGPDSPEGPPRDPRVRDCRPRAAVLHDGGGTPAVLQDPTDRVRGRDRLRASRGDTLK